MRYDAIRSLLGLRFFSLEGKQLNFRQNHVVSFFIEPNKGTEATGYVVNLGDGQFQFVVEDGGRGFDGGTKGDIVFVNNLTSLTYSLSLERLNIEYEDESYINTEEGSVKREKSVVKLVELKNDTDREKVAGMLASFIPFPSFAFIGDIELEKGSVGLFNVNEMVILEETVDDSGIPRYLTPFSQLEPYVKEINGVPCLATYRLMAKAHEEAYVFDVSLSDGKITEGDKVELIAPTYRTEVEYKGNKYKLKSLANFNNIPIRTSQTVEPFVLHYGMKADEEGVFDCSLSLSLMEEFVPLADDYASVTSEEAYKNLVFIHPFASVNIASEVEALDDRLRTYFTNFGVPDPKDYQGVFKDAPNTELDARFINKKSKELYLIHNDIFPYAGTYKGLLNAVNFLGYDDIFFREWYTSIDKEGQKSPDVGFISVDVKKGSTLSSKLKSTNITYGNFLNLKKLGKLSLVYNLNKQVGEDENGEPIMQDVYDYTNDVLLLKLYALRSWLMEYIIGLHADITDVVGEATYHKGHPTVTYTTGGVSLEFRKSLPFDVAAKSYREKFTETESFARVVPYVATSGDTLNISEFGDATFNDVVDYILDMSTSNDSGFYILGKYTLGEMSQMIRPVSKWVVSNSLHIPIGPTFSRPMFYDEVEYKVEKKESETFALFEGLEDDSPHILIRDGVIGLSNRMRPAVFKKSSLPSLHINKGRIYRYDKKYGLFETVYTINRTGGRTQLIKDDKVIHSSREHIIISPSRDDKEACRFEYNKADDIYNLVCRYSILGDGEYAFVIDDGYLSSESAHDTKDTLGANTYFADETIYFDTVINKTLGSEHKKVSGAVSYRTETLSVYKWDFDGFFGVDMISFDNILGMTNINDLYWLLSERIKPYIDYGYIKAHRTGRYKVRGFTRDESNNAYSTTAKEEVLVTHIDHGKRGRPNEICLFTEKSSTDGITTSVIVEPIATPKLPYAERVRSTGSAEVTMDGKTNRAILFEDTTISSSFSKDDFIYMDNHSIRSVGEPLFLDGYVFVKLKRDANLDTQGVTHSGTLLSLALYNRDHGVRVDDYSAIVERAYQTLKSIPEEDKKLFPDFFDSDEITYLKIRIKDDKTMELKDKYEALRAGDKSIVDLLMLNANREQVIASSHYCRNWLIDGYKFASIPIRSYTDKRFRYGSVVKLTYMREIGLSGEHCISECAFQVLDIKKLLEEPKEHSVFWKFKKLVEDDRELKRLIYSSITEELVFIDGWIDENVARRKDNERISVLSGNNNTKLYISNAHNAFVKYVGVAETSQSLLNATPFITLNEETSLYAKYMDSTFNLYGRTFDEEVFRNMWLTQKDFGSEVFAKLFAGGETTYKDLLVYQDRATIQPNTNVVFGVSMESAPVPSFIPLWRLYNETEGRLIGECHNWTMYLSFPKPSNPKGVEVYRAELDFLDANGNRLETKKPFFLKVKN